ncbi:cytochrome c biogenesis protein family [Prunus dulcis]|uniref:Cytochrome c biogenesis protein family n=1 Tax=Prunus dulcis TaxID=3755 RepID=A0A4Y1RCB6_PRUDU|nr:cytochrome c biogenesis protein family [Prunus dulcis]
MNLAINHCGSYGINSFTISSCKGGQKSSHGKYMVPIRMLRGPSTSTPQDLSQDLASLAKSDTSSSFPFKTAVNSMAVANLVFADMAKGCKHRKELEFFSESGRCCFSYTLADGGPGEWFGGFLFSAGQEANEAVQDQLSALSFSSLAVIFGAGLVTSLSPCTLSVLPLTLGLHRSIWIRKSKAEDWQLTCTLRHRSLILLERHMDRQGRGYLWASGLAIVMGLNLLEVIELQLPSFFNNFDPGLLLLISHQYASVGHSARICSYIEGGSLLLTYTTGYVAPLLLAASFAGALQRCTSVRRGVYTFLDRLFPVTVAM